MIENKGWVVNEWMNGRMKEISVRLNVCSIDFVPKYMWTLTSVRIPLSMAMEIYDGTRARACRSLANPNHVSF